MEDELTKLLELLPGLARELASAREKVEATEVIVESLRQHVDKMAQRGTMETHVDAVYDSGGNADHHILRVIARRIDEIDVDVHQLKEEGVDR